MNRISRWVVCLILASVISLSFAVQTFSQVGNEGSKSRLNPASLISNINRFNSSVAQAEPTLGDQRIFFLLAAVIGIQPQLIQIDFQHYDLSISNFIMAEIIASLANDNLANDNLVLVVGLFNQNLSVDTILQQVNVDRDIFILALRIFSATFNNEVATASGSPQITPDQMDQQLNNVINRTDEDFLSLNNSFGPEQFNVVLDQQLSLATGLQVSEILTLLGDIPSTATVGEFAIALLAANSIAFTTGNGNFNSGTVSSDQINNLITSADLVNALNINNIPVNLFVGRVRLLLRLIINAENNGPMPLLH
jgi:hypothetical protein